MVATGPNPARNPLVSARARLCLGRTSGTPRGRAGGSTATTA
ncbi:hypothetical protein [Methylobacterium currus]|nr:hypothetical protein [Methylobacterium currus]